MVKINYYDPNIPNKSKKSNEVFQFIKDTKILLPSEVEISESGTCNRKCSFCAIPLMRGKHHSKTIDSLTSLNVPAGVDISIKL